MDNNNNVIDSLKQTLSSATKNKLRKDVYGLKLRNIEREYSEELTSMEAEIEFTTEELKELKNQISTMRHQISLVAIYETSERIKIQSHINELNNRKKSFDGIFERARHGAESRKKELEQNEKEELELLRQKETETAQKIEKLAMETVAVETDCEAIERECAVLKKRNAAIMLKLRRKLVETENLRKDLLKKKNSA